MTYRSKMALGVSGCIVVLTFLGGLAWACTAQQQLSILPRSGPAGSTVTVNGLGFNGPESSSTTEIRWNTLDGPLLATASNPDFSLSLNAPADAEEGVYYLTVVQRGPDGSVITKSSETFEVTSTGQSRSTGQAQQDLWSGFDPGKNSGTMSTSLSRNVPGTRSLALGLALAGIGVMAVCFTLVTIRNAPSKTPAGRANSQPQKANVGRGL